ncbi:MAG TPA: hypothetical protein VIK97_00405, partial [Casimicrobiaceae bacterium]
MPTANLAMTGEMMIGAARRTGKVRTNNPRYRGAAALVARNATDRLSPAISTDGKRHALVSMLT